jgi:choline kinase
LKVILLAAGRGKRFGKRTKALPKCLIPIGGSETLLKRYFDAFRKNGLRDIVLVVGHQKEKILHACKKYGRGLSIRSLENKAFKQGSIVSLRAAAAELNDDCLIMDADVYFEPSALKKLLAKKSSVFLLDPDSKSAGEEMMLMARGARLVKISKKTDRRLRIVGEATGFFKVVKRDAIRLASILKNMVGRGIVDVEYEDSYNELMKITRPGFVSIEGFWTEMDFEEDLKKIRKVQTRKT